MNCYGFVGICSLARNLKNRRGWICFFLTNDVFVVQKVDRQNCLSDVFINAIKSGFLARIERTKRKSLSKIRTVSGVDSFGRLEKYARICYQLMKILLFLSLLKNGIIIKMPKIRTVKSNSVKDNILNIRSVIMLTMRYEMHIAGADFALFRNLEQEKNRSKIIAEEIIIKKNENGIKEENKKNKAKTKETSISNR